MLWLGRSPSVQPAEWQWSITVDSVISAETQDHPRAFLWIPPDCRQVRAVVVGQHNLLEEGILEDSIMRQELARLGIAEIWITPVLDTWQNATNNAAANEHFNAIGNNPDSAGDEISDEGHRRGLAIRPQPGTKNKVSRAGGADIQPSTMTHEPFIQITGCTPTRTVTLFLRPKKSRGGRRRIPRFARNQARN
jgi:hypothetical protein